MEVLEYYISVPLHTKETSHLPALPPHFCQDHAHAHTSLDSRPAEPRHSQRAGTLGIRGMSKARDVLAIVCCTDPGWGCCTAFLVFSVLLYDVFWWTMRLWGYIHFSKELWWTIMQVIDAMIGMNFRDLRPGSLSPAQFTLYSSVMQHQIACHGASRNHGENADDVHNLSPWFQPLPSIHVL